MKIKAKKTNSASENAITSVLFTYHEMSFMQWSHLHGIECRVKKLTVLQTTNNNQSYGTDSWAEELFNY